jgi:hypothetical protein
VSIIVIPCGKAKQSLPSAARDLYIGTSFRLARAAAEADGRDWLILSSRYGLVAPDTVIAPYEQVTKSTTDVQRLTAILRTQVRRGETVESWCPEAYNRALIAAGAVVSEPLRGKRQGERAAWWKARVS